MNISLYHFFCQCQNERLIENISDRARLFQSHSHILGMIGRGRLVGSRGATCDTS